MQINKVTVNIRKIVNRESAEQIRVRSEKFALRSPSDSAEKIIQASSRRLKILHKFRHTSVMEEDQPTPRPNLRLRNNLSTDQETKASSKKFPEIYNPSLTAQRNLQTKNNQNKLKSDSATGPLVKLRVESEHNSEKQVRPVRRRQSCSYGKNLPLLPPETLKQITKQMTKQKRGQVFKAIRAEFYSLINTSNLLSVRNHDTSFKAYIEKGNNGLLVKEIISKRWWWHIQQDKNKANLVWTQWFDKSVIAGLQSIAIEDGNYTQQYKCRKYQQNNKQEAVLKLVDSQTFAKLQRKITSNIQSNTYFKKPKKSSFPIPQPLLQENLRAMTVQPDQIIHNHVQGCLNLHSKKLLFMNFYNFMLQKKWDPFEFIPLSFHIQSQTEPTLNTILSKFDQFQTLKLTNPEIKNIWIIKPGENSNRGCGIKVINSKQDLLQQIRSRLPPSNPHRSLIIQKYLQKCYLIHNRKFDIRCYILLTTVNGSLKGYWYRDGYIRTSSLQYSLEDIGNEMIHLTNDAVQKRGESFGKFEDSNKLGFEYFRGYLRKQGVPADRFDQAYEQMKLIAYYMIASVGGKINRKQYTFQLFGLDFMLDQKLKPVLIEANSNPCLSNHGKILGKLIHELVQNVFMTAIDPIFPPPAEHNHKRGKNEVLSRDYFESNKFELIFTAQQPKINGKVHQQCAKTQQ